MSRFHSYLNSAVQILSEYDGNTPFSLFIKRFFSKHKKYGSRDRRLIADYCYQYFRIGKAFQKLPVEERILTGIFLCSSGPTRMMEIHNPEWNQITNKSLEEKIIQIEITEQQLLNTLFPWEQELSDGIEFERFAKSYFAKPSVFIRVRSQKRETVRLKLKGHHIPFKEISEHTFSVEANSKLDQLLKLDSEVVIQDLSSQKIREFLPEVLGNKELKVWDCCAASGGKSILAFDINPMIKLTVSDIRTSILKNLEERFLSAGINNFQSYEIDLTQEQLFYFEESKIEEYANLQRSIISNAVLHLNNGGFLVYITCSVFKKENEANIEFLVTEFGLNEIRTEVLKGYNQKADSMFVSVLKKDF